MQLYHLAVLGAAALGSMLPTVEAKSSGKQQMVCSGTGNYCVEGMTQSQGGSAQMVPIPMKRREVSELFLGNNRIDARATHVNMIEARATPAKNAAAPKTTKGPNPAHAERKICPFPLYL